MTTKILVGKILYKIWRYIAKLGRNVQKQKMEILQICTETCENLHTLKNIWK